MFTKELLFAIPIAILYPFFWNKGIDVMYGLTELHNEKDACYDKFNGGKKYSFIDDYGSSLKKETNPNLQPCLDEYSAKINRVKYHRYLILLAVGVITLVMSHYVKSEATQLGLAIGGIITIFYATFAYWNKMNEKMKFGATGAGLAVLIYYSYKFFSDGNSLQKF
jgi:hypothetical protein